MNLHAVVAPVIGAVNPLIPVNLLVSIGATSNPDFTKSAAYATPGSFTASIGGAFTASSSGTTLAVADVSSGSLQVGDIVSGTDGTNALQADTVIIQQLSGAAGGVGTYQMSAGASPGDLGSCEIASLSEVLNVTAIAQGQPQAGQELSDATGALLPGTLITGQINGQPGGPGLYSINQMQTVAAETMIAAMVIIAQVQPVPASALRQIDGINLQGSHRWLYANGLIRGIIRFRLKGGDLCVLPDGSVWLVTQTLEGWNTAGWSKVLITLQNTAPFNPLGFQPTANTGIG